MIEETLAVREEVACRDHPNNNRLIFLNLKFTNCPYSKVSTISSKFCIDVDPDKVKSLYVVKLRACYKLADFSDSKKDTEFKEQKKECMIDLIDTLDDPNLAP